MGSQDAIWSCPCRRSDMVRTMLIFGGLFISAIAICSTLEVSAPAQGIDEVTVADNENVIGPVGADAAPVDCKDKNGRKSLPLHLQRCDKDSAH